MKRQYITPSILVVKLDTRCALLQNISVNNSTVISSENIGDVGFTKEYDNSSVSGKNVWDEEW